MESVCMSMCVWEVQINSEKVVMACDSGWGMTKHDLFQDLARVEGNNPDTKQA